MKRLKSFVKMIGAFFALLLLFGVIVEACLRYIDKQSLDVPGTLLEVNGDKMHLFSIGDGEKTIVLIPGLGTTSPYTDFQPLWSRLSKDHRVLVIERFGYGFSDVTSKERSLPNIIDEMDQALANESGPFTLVGHSFGGLIAIGYTQQFPEKVENIVMLDSRVPSSYEELPKGAHVMAVIGRILNYTGLNRLAQMEVVYDLQEMNSYLEVPKQYWETGRKLYLRNSMNRNIRSELKMLGESSQFVTNNNIPYETPILFISTPGLLDRDKEAEYIEKLQKGELIEYDGGHHVHQYFPNEISDAIDNFIK